MTIHSAGCNSFFLDLISLLVLDAAQCLVGKGWHMAQVGLDPLVSFSQVMPTA